MAGLVFIFVVFIWIAIVFCIARFLAGRFQEFWWRPLVGVLIFMVVLPLPVADEIIWGRKFEQLCQSKASEISVDAVGTQGRNVWYGGSQNMKINFGTIKATQTRINFVDAKTQEPLYHYYQLYAKGGWLVHTLGVFEGNPPLIFDGVCQPDREKIETIDTQLGLISIRRPTSK